MHISHRVSCFVNGRDLPIKLRRIKPSAPWLAIGDRSTPFQVHRPGGIWGNVFFFFF
jgi:hypothetical protein